MTAALILMAPGARAEGLADEIGLDRLTGAAGAYLEEYLDMGELTGESFLPGVRSILEGGRDRWPGILRQGATRGLLLLGVGLLCGLADTGSRDFGAGGLDPAGLAGTAAVTVIATADLNALLGLGSHALEEMDAFSKLLLPAVTAACAAAGMPAAAAARQGATLLFLGLLLTLAERLILPLVYACVAAQAAGAALGNEGLKRLGTLFKGAATGMITFLVSGFVLYLTITGAVAGSTDVMTQKAAKTAISGMIPVVGGILSDAAEAVVAGAGILRGTVGVVGLLAVLAICMLPFLRLGVQYLVYKLVAALSATVAPGPVAGLIDGIGSAFALVLGMVGGGGMILYVALITSIRAVGG